MAAYLVGLGRVHDQERFAKYAAGVPPTIAPFNGKLVAIEDPAEVLEGDAAFPRVFVLQFPSKADARNWEKSAAYKAIEPDRLASSDHVLYLLEGFTPPA